MHKEGGASKNSPLIDDYIATEIHPSQELNIVGNCNSAQFWQD